MLFCLSPRPKPLFTLVGVIAWARENRPESRFCAPKVVKSWLKVQYLGESDQSAVSQAMTQGSCSSKGDGYVWEGWLEWGVSSLLTHGTGPCTLNAVGLLPESGQVHYESLPFLPLLKSSGRFSSRSPPVGRPSDFMRREQSTFVN